jgi:hypothetical protein
MSGRIFGFFALGLAVSLAVISPTKALAQTKLGEIININYKYKIAFADLTQNDVQPGDKVAVKDTNGATVYLEAVETYPVMVKLSIASIPGYELSDDQFTKIIVGSHVNVVDQAMFRSLPANPHQAVVPDQKRPAPGRIKPAEKMKVYDPGKITTRIESVTSPAEPKPSPVVQETPAPVAARDASTSGNMDYKVAMLQQKVDKLVDSNLAMADQITKLLKEKTALEEVLKNKDSAITIARDQILNITNTSKPQDQEIKDLQKQLAKLGEEKAAADREIADLNQKMSALKKKLARMIELLNKHTKNL